MELEKINRLLDEGLLDEARTTLEHFLKMNGVESSNYLKGCKLLVDIYERKGESKQLPSKRFLFASALFNSNNFEEAVIQLEKIAVIQECLKGKIDTARGAMPSISIAATLELLWKSYISLGELDCAASVADSYLTFVSAKKLVDRGIEFISQMAAYKKDYSMSEIVTLIKLNSLKGDYSEAARLLKQVKWSISEQYDVACFIDREMEGTENSKEISEFVMQSFILKLDSLGRQVITARGIHKKILNAAYQYLIRYPEGKEGIQVILNYAFKHSKLQIVENLGGYCREESDDELRQLALGMLDRIKNIEKSGIDNYELTDLDLGEDLFSGEDENTKIKSLERDIKFLIKKGKIDEAKKLAVQLTIYDSENTLLMDITKINNDSFAEGKGKKIDDVEEELRGRISEFVTVDDPQKIEVAGLNTIVDYYSDEELAAIGMDLLFCFMSMKCFAVSERLIRRIDDGELMGNSLEQKLAYEYLRLMLYLDAGKLHEALVRCDEIVRTWPLNDREKVIFLYLVGEIYLRQGKRDLALGAFRGVWVLDPDYKMVDLRIKELEGS